jgi:hypothetical protein
MNESFYLKNWNKKCKIYVVWKLRRKKNKKKIKKWKYIMKNKKNNKFLKKDKWDNAIKIMKLIISDYYQKTVII